jgi:hypothetical protein
MVCFFFLGPCLQMGLEGVVEVVVSPPEPDTTANRGFCFVEFVDHHHAVEAHVYVGSAAATLVSAPSLGAARAAKSQRA